MVRVGAIENSPPPFDIGGFQNLAITVEMFLSVFSENPFYPSRAAIAHHFAFSYQPYVESSVTSNLLENAKHM
jgi:hypothetical protein